MQAYINVYFIFHGLLYISSQTSAKFIFNMHARIQRGGGTGGPDPTP